MFWFVNSFNKIWKNLIFLKFFLILEEALFFDDEKKKILDNKILITRQIFCIIKTLFNTATHAVKKNSSRDSKNTGQ